MLLTLYYNKDENNKVTKTNLQFLLNSEVYFKEATNTFNPSILIDRSVPGADFDITKATYAKLFPFYSSSPRYYFVTNSKNIRNEIWQLDLLEDVLMQHGPLIRQQTAIIARQENSYNPQLFDPLLPVNVGRQKEYIQLADPSNERFGSDHIDNTKTCYVLLTAKGGSV